MKNCTHCNNEFVPKSKNQKYCNPDCCRKATNKKIMEKYYENKERLKGKVRFCSQCGLKLSMYNPDSICYNCDNLNRKINSKLLREAFDFVSKQVR